jgi:hypothetical protein
MRDREEERPGTPGSVDRGGGLMQSDIRGKPLEGLEGGFAYLDRATGAGVAISVFFELSHMAGGKCISAVIWTSAFARPSRLESFVT